MASEREKKVLMKIEDIINIAIDVNQQNTVNFRLIQTVLRILARHLRLLEMRVEIRTVDAGVPDGEDEHGSLSKKTADHEVRGATSKIKRRDTISKSKKEDDDSPRRGKKGKGKKEKDNSSDEELPSKSRSRSKGRKGEDDSPRKSEEKSKRRKSEVDRAKSMTRSEVVEPEKGKKKKGSKEKPDSEDKVGRNRTNIEVVTRAQFEQLEDMVNTLLQYAGPLPMPTMPDNATLRKELASGSADLATTMNAMQVNARVQAAEEAITNLSDLLSQLAAAGALPPDVMSRVEQVQLLHDEMLETREGIDMKGLYASLASSKSILKAASPGVTQSDLKEILDNATDDLKKHINSSIARATSLAENSAMAAKSISEKLEFALKLDNRLSTLYSLVTDYAEQLSGFDSGLTIQMQGFQEQMSQIRGDLKEGLLMLDTANNNAETAAVMELTERYQGLETALEVTLHSHSELTIEQKQLEEQMKNLATAVEMMREEKADRDEVLDALRDKADSSRLSGLLTESQFVMVAGELDKRLAACHDKFNKQEIVWMQALKDLHELLNQKADVYYLSSTRDELDAILNDLHCKLIALARVIGEPKAAILTRVLSRGAICGACKVAALMEAEDVSRGAPPLLPAARAPGAPPLAPPPSHRDECLADLNVQLEGEETGHVCRRWVGGSHTMLARAGPRGRAEPDTTLHGPDSRKYTAYGGDGRLYMFEEPCLPCAECNKAVDDQDLAAPPTTDNNGGGDQAGVKAVSIIKLE